MRTANICCSAAALSIALLSPSCVSAEGNSGLEPIWVNGDQQFREATYLRLNSGILEDGLLSKSKTLGEAVFNLSQDHGIQAVINLVALDDLGINQDEPVSTSIKGSLAQTLTFMLRPLELTYVVQNNILIITTEEDALTYLEPVIYPLGDLVSTDEQLDQVTDLIMLTIAPDSWAENGGGEAEIAYASTRRALVVTQTPSVHLQLQRLLKQLQGLPLMRELRDEHAVGNSAEDAARKYSQHEAKNGGGTF